MPPAENGSMNSEKRSQRLARLFRAFDRARARVKAERALDAQPGPNQDTLPGL